MAPAEHGTVRSADGIDVHYTVHGSAGPAIVLLHGWSCDARFWEAQLSALAREYVVITIDLPGHGRSHAAPGARRWSMEAYGRDVAAVVDDAGVERVAVAGHSMGGAVALEAAIALGARCAFLLGIDTLTETTFYTARPAAEIAARCAPFRADFATAIARMVEAITFPSSDRAVPAAIVRMMCDNDPAVAVAVLAALLAWDVRPRRGRVAGTIETINSAMLARRDAFLAIDDVIVHELENVGHFPMLEAPAAFNERLLDVLARRYPAERVVRRPR